MSTQIVNPIQLFTDLSGLPLDAGRVFIGKSNTNPVTNPIEVYLDSALTIAINQPLRTTQGAISRNGKPTQIFIDDSDYSIAVFDKNGRLIESVPQVTDDFAAFVKNLAAPTGSSLVGFIQAGTGAVARTMQAKARESVSILDFGAKSDGVTDDTAAVNDGIAYLQSVGGGSLLFPADTTLIAGTLAITRNGVRLQGASRRASILKFANADKDCITVVGTVGVNVYGFEMDNLYLQHAGKTAGRSLVLAYCSKVVIHDVDVENCWTGWDIWVTNDVAIQNVFFQGVVGGAAAPTFEGTFNPGACYAIFFHAPGDNSARSDVLTTVNVGANLLNSGADGFVWDGQAETWNAFQLTAISPRFGLHITNSAASASFFPQFGVFDNFAVDGATHIAAQIEAGSGMDFVNSEMTSNGPGGTYGLVILPDVGGSFTSAIRVTNTRIGLGNQNAVYCGARDVVFTNADFISGAATAANTYSAILIDTPAQDIQVIACKTSTWGAANNWAYGAEVNAGTVRIMLIANNFSNSVRHEVLWRNTDSQSRCMLNISTTANDYDPAPYVTPGSVTAAAGTLLTPQQMLGGVLERDGPVAAFTDTTPTAADLAAACQSPMYSKGIPTMLINIAGVPWTLSGGAGVGMSGNTPGGNIVVAPNSTKVVMVLFTDVAPGSEAVTIYG